MVKFSFLESKNESSLERARNSKYEALSTLMVDRKSTFETAKSAQPVLSALHKPPQQPHQKEVSNNAENNNCSIGPFQTVKDSIWWRYLLAGGIAGGISRTVTAPLDRLKIYTQVHAHSMSLFKLLGFLVQQGGIFSLWRGNLVNVLKIMPESAIKFTAYELLKRRMRGDELRQLEISERFVAGATAGGIAQSLLYPLEVIKVRLSMNSSTHVDGFKNIARNIYRTNGFLGFYRGYLPNILGCVPYGGIEFTVYEALKRRYTSYLALGEEPSFITLSIISSFSTTVGQCCVYPLSLARTRLQSGLFGNEKLISIFRNILINDGPRGLYRGLLPNICKVVPAVSINFVVYEYASRTLGITMT